MWKEHEMDTKGPSRRTHQAPLWDRAVSRRQFVVTTAGATGALFASRLWMPDLAHAQAPLTSVEQMGGAMPMPIPGGTMTPFGVFIHHHPFPPGAKDPNEIGNFQGLFGILHASGTGTGTDTSSGATTPLLWATDSGFMVGDYVGTDGKSYRDTFAFI
jgi:hypothetical protein